MFESPQGLAVAGHYRGGSSPHEQGIWLAWSDDDGRTWGAPHRVLTRHLVEPAVIHAGGRYLALIRDRSSTGPYWQAVAAGAGATPWPTERGQAPGGDDTDGTAPSPFINVDPDKARRLWALDSRRGQQPRTGRVALWTAELDDEEAAPRWTSVGTVVRWRGDAGGHEDFSYPWMARVEDHRWLLVFYSGARRGRSDMFALDLELDPATGRATATSVTP